MQKWLHTLGSIGLIALTAFTPVIQGAISSHPLVAAILGGAWGVLGHLLPSPIAKS